MRVWLARSKPLATLSCTLLVASSIAARRSGEGLNRPSLTLIEMSLYVSLASNPSTLLRFLAFGICHRRQIIRPRQGGDARELLPEHMRLRYTKMAGLRLRSLWKCKLLESANYNSVESQKVHGLEITC